MSDNFSEERKSSKEFYPEKNDAEKNNTLKKVMNEIEKEEKENEK